MTDKDKFILFYMIGCGHCNRFEPTWNNLKNNYLNVYDFIKCESNDLNNSREAHDIQTQLNMNIDGFPSIFCKVDNKYYYYEGNREEEDLINFIKSKKTNKSENKSENIIEKNDIKFFYFYMENCKWCKEFSNVWEQIKSEKYDCYECERSNIKKSPEAKEIQNTLDLRIKSYPSIFIKVNNLYYKYNGERTLEKILEYIARIIHKNKSQNGGNFNYRNKYKKYKEMYFELLEKYNKIK